MYRFTPRTRMLRELLDKGEIGEVRFISSNWRFLIKDNSNVRVNEALGGGSLRDVGCYPINLIGMIMQDEPDIRLRAKASPSRGSTLALSAVLKYKNGVLCTVSSGFNAQSPVVTEINGTRGTILMRETYDQTDAPILLIKDGVTTELAVPACKRYVLELEAFSAAILENREAPLDLEETVRNNRLIERILKLAT